MKICIIDTQEKVAVHMCGFDGIWRGNYFKEEPIGRAEVEVRVSKLKNGKAISKNEITRLMLKGGGDRGKGKLLSGIKSMYIDRSAYVRVKGDESKQFRIDSGVKQGCIMSPWLFNIYIWME